MATPRPRLLRALSLTALLLLVPAAMRAAEKGDRADRPEILRPLRTGHPRIWITPDALKALRQAVRPGGPRHKVFAEVKEEADRLLKRRGTVEYKIVGPRLLSQSRRCLSRVQTLGLTYLLTGEAKYAERAWRELEAASAFPDWNPSHFLDTAEMSCAFGIGYDWLYHWMDEAKRRTVREALLEKGLARGLDAYRGKARWGWWTRSTHNWSQVCNGGLAVGALAVADEAPDVAAEILTSGLKAVDGAMKNFGPDGSWNEGPGYWGYTLRYTSNYMAALQSALGTMHGLQETDGLDEAGTFRVYFVGPTNRVFNFADAHDGAGRRPSMFWLARVYDEPVYAWHHRQRMDGEAKDVLWYVGEGRSPKDAGWPLHKHFRRDHVVFFRSAWQAPHALWVGFKGGDNRANHSHLDLGSFVLDALGVRWAVDLGSDNYNLPGYFGGKRWTYYRLRTESHNTLLIDGKNQPPKAKAPVTHFRAGADDACAVVELSAAYPMCKRVRRGMAMLGRRAVLVQDEVEAEKPVEVLWGMVTRAEPKIENGRVVLERDGKRLYGRVLAPEGARFDTVSANPPKPQRQQPDAVKLVVRLPEKVTEVRLAVTFSPDAKALGRVEVRPLEGWAAEPK
ncbi:MAG: heparinase II/III family protein [Phycisphaerae bacterium]